MSLKYVALTGSDGAAGTIGAPYLTLRFAVAQLVPGDTLYIRGGTYTGATNTIASNFGLVLGGTGTANPIVISAYPGETVTIQPPTTLSGILLHSSAQQYITFQDLIIDGVNNVTDSTAASLVYLSGGAHHNTFLRVEVKNGGWCGFVTSMNNGAASFNTFRSCLAHGVGDPSGPGTNGHGFYIGTPDNLIELCTVYDNQGEGIQTNGNSATDCSRNVIRKNRVYNNGARSSTTGFNIVIIRGADILVYDNLVYSDGRTNLFGIYVYVETLNAKVFNNTIYGHGNDGISLEYYDSAQPPQIINNILWGNTNNTPHDRGDLNGNTGTPIIHHNISADPSFVNAGTADFHIQTGSVAKNAGTTLVDVPDDFDGATRPQGTAYCCGAYEYVSGGGGGAGTFTFVNSDAGDATGTSASTSARNHIAGNMLVSFVRNTDPAGPSGVRNTAGDVFTKVPNSRVSVGATGYLEIWYCLASLGNAADVVTADFAASTAIDIVVHQVSYTTGTTASYDTQVTATDASAASISATISPSQANAYIVGGTAIDTVETSGWYVAGSGYTKRQFNDYVQQTEDRADGAVGSQTIAMSGSSGSVAWALSAAVFILSGGSATGNFTAAAARVSAILGSGVY